MTFKAKPKASMQPNTDFYSYPLQNDNAFKPKRTRTRLFFSGNFTQAEIRHCLEEARRIVEQQIKDNKKIKTCGIDLCCYHYDPENNITEVAFGPFSFSSSVKECPSDMGRAKGSPSYFIVMDAALPHCQDKKYYGSDSLPYNVLVWENAKKIGASIFAKIMAERGECLDKKQLTETAISILEKLSKESLDYANRCEEESSNSKISPKCFSVSAGPRLKELTYQPKEYELFAKVNPSKYKDIAVRCFADAAFKQMLSVIDFASCKDFPYDEYINMLFSEIEDGLGQRALNHVDD